jgi:predicted P-loop ATPase/GTPase
MPEVSRFYGIIIQIYYGDHAPPHFHALYAGAVAKIAIGTLQVIDGALPRRALSLVLDWASMHQQELLEAFNRAAAFEAPGKIAPLE